MVDRFSHDGKIMVRGDPIGLFIFMTPRDQLREQLVHLERFQDDKEEFYSWLSEQKEISPEDGAFKKLLAAQIES